MLRRLITAFALCVLTFPAFGQSSSGWQIALITEVKPHPASKEGASDTRSYDVSVRAGETIYVVLYTQPLGDIPPKYEVGRELLVLVGKKGITYNDILGRSLEVPIESQRPATESKRSK